MLQELFIRKPKLSGKEIAATLFAKLFKAEVRRIFKRIKDDLASGNQKVNKDRLTLTIISLLVFIVDYSTFSVYGNSRTRNKILQAFHALIKQEFNGYESFIIELSQKFDFVYRRYPEDPLFGLGLYFSKCINNNKNDLLTAMVGTTESAKKYKLITSYYNQLNQEYKIN